MMGRRPWEGPWPVQHRSKVMTKQELLEQFVGVLEDVRWYASTLDNQARTLRRAARQAEHYYLDNDNVNQLTADLVGVSTRISVEMEIMSDTIAELRKMRPFQVVSEDPERDLDNRPRRVSDL